MAMAIERSNKAPVLFKMAGGEVKEWETATASAPENGRYPVIWRYPVFQDANTSQLRKLNGWARTISLEGLFQAPELSRDALAMKDSQVLAAIGNDKETRESVGMQSELIPERVFGPYIFFTRFIAWLGGTRPQHEIVKAVFDYEAGREASIQSLFKPEIEDELVSLLEEAITRSFDEDKVAYKQCLKKRIRDLNIVCEKSLNDDNIAACVGLLSFDWKLLSVNSSQKLAIDFPYNPALHSMCGDGLYLLEGNSIEKLFVSPAQFRKGSELRNLQPRIR